MGNLSRSFFREIGLIKEERLLVDNHIISGIIEDIYNTGEIVYAIDSASVFHTSIMNQHGTLFFNAMGESCFVAVKIFFQPPKRIILIPMAEIAIDRRKNSRIATPNLLAKIYEGEIRMAEKAFITDLCLCGAGISHFNLLKSQVIYNIQTSFPFRNRTLGFLAKCVVKHTKNKKSMFISGICFSKMESESRDNLSKYIERITT